MKQPLSKEEYIQTVQALISQSILFVVAEFRGYKVETIAYLDKKTNQHAEFSRIICNVESQAQSAESLTLSLPIPQGYKTLCTDAIQKTYTIVPEKEGIPPFDLGLKKGQTVLATIDTAERKMGHVTYRAMSYSPINKEETPAPKK